VRLAELVASLLLSRANVFELVKPLPTTTSKVPGPGGRGRLAWVTAAAADADWVALLARFADIHPVVLALSDELSAG
jgi:hypothetical protein